MAHFLARDVKELNELFDTYDQVEAVNGLLDMRTYPNGDVNAIPGMPAARQKRKKALRRGGIKAEGGNAGIKTEGGNGGIKTESCDPVSLHVRRREQEEKEKDKGQGGADGAAGRGVVVVVIWRRRRGVAVAAEEGEEVEEAGRGERQLGRLRRRAREARLAGGGVGREGCSVSTGVWIAPMWAREMFKAID
jgi:hypothetical protein